MRDYLEGLKGAEKTKLELLRISLSAAVPLWIDTLSTRSWEYRDRRAKACASIVCEKGDVILYRSKKSGETARAFNAMAEGIACLAFAPGGVDVFGLHFEAPIPEEED